MADDSLIAARKRVERAVEGIADGPLKIAAFQSILAKLLTDPDPGERVQHRSGKVPARKGEQPDTLAGRILAIEWSNAVPGAPTTSEA
jgi:hypothetical protein